MKGLNSMTTYRQMTFTGVLWYPKLYYCVYKSSPLVPIQNRTNPSYLFQINLNTFLPSKLRSSKWSLSFRFSCHSSVCICLPTDMCYILLLSHPSWFAYPNNYWRGIQVINLFIMTLSPVCSTQNDTWGCLLRNFVSIYPCAKLYLVLMFR